MGSFMNKNGSNGFGERTKIIFFSTRLFVSYWACVRKMKKISVMKESN